MREKNISDDKTGTEKVIKEFLKKIENSKIKYIFCIYPASPLLKSKDLKKAHQIFIKQKLDYLVSIAKFQSNPERSLVIKNNSLKFKYPKNAKRILKILKINTMIQVISIFIQKFLLERSKKKIRKGFYILEQFRALDINSLEDFENAKKFSNYLNEN